MATLITKTIREDGSGDYTTTAAWEAAEQKDLVAADEIHRGLIQQSWVSAETVELIITGWTTDATRKVILEAEGAARHIGIFTTTAHRWVLTGNPSGFGVVLVNQSHVQLIGLQVTLKNVTAGSKATFAGGILNNDILEMDGCIGVVDNPLTIASNFLFILTKTNRIRNCLAYQINTNANRVRAFSWIDNIPVSTSYAYNCNAVNHRSNSQANGFYMHKATEQVRVINCLANNNEGQGFFEVFASSYEAGSGFNAADDTIPPTAKGTGSRENQTFVFVNEVTQNNFHLDAGDKGARDFGTDTTALAVDPFSNDIDGDTRVTLFDIGMDEPPPFGQVDVDASILVEQNGEVQVDASIAVKFQGEVEVDASIGVAQNGVVQVDASINALVNGQVNVAASIVVEQNSEVQVAASIVAFQNGEVEVAASIVVIQNGEVQVSGSIAAKFQGEVQVDASTAVKFQGEVQVAASVQVLQNSQVSVDASIVVEQNGEVQVAASINTKVQGLVPIIASIGVLQNGIVQVAASIAVDIGGRVQVDASINASQNGEVEVVASIGVLLRIDGQVTADGSINALQNNQVQVAASIQAVSLAAVIASASIVVRQNAQVTVPVSISVLQGGGKVQIDASIGAKQNSQVAVAASIQAAVFTIVDGQVQVGASIQTDFRVGLDDRSGAVERDYIPNSGRFVVRNGTLFIVDNETLIRRQKPPEGFGWDLDELLVDTNKPGSYPLQYKIDRDGGEFGMGVLRIEIPDDWIKT